MVQSFGGLVELVAVGGGFGVAFDGTGLRFVPIVVIRVVGLLGFGPVVLRLFLEHLLVNFLAQPQLHLLHQRAFDSVHFILQIKHSAAKQLSSFCHHPSTTLSSNPQPVLQPFPLSPFMQIHSYPRDWSQPIVHPHQSIRSTPISDDTHQLNHIHSNRSNHADHRLGNHRPAKQHELLPVFRSHARVRDPNVRPTPLHAHIAPPAVSNTLALHALALRTETTHHPQHTSYSR